MTAVLPTVFPGIFVSQDASLVWSALGGVFLLCAIGIMFRDKEPWSIARVVCWIALILLPMPLLEPVQTGDGEWAVYRPNLYLTGWILLGAFLVIPMFKLNMKKLAQVILRPTEIWSLTVIGGLVAFAYSAARLHSLHGTSTVVGQDGYWSPLIIVPVVIGLILAGTSRILNKAQQ